MGPGKGARRWLAFGAMLALPALVLFRKVLFGGETFVERDLLAFHRADRMTFVRLFSEVGGIPLWSPYVGSGQPFACNPQHQIFHPITWLFVVLPFEWAYRLQVVLPVVLSGFSMAFLLLTLGRSRYASFLGAGAWAYGGYVLSTTNIPPTLFGIVGVPLLLAFLCRAARSGEASDAAGLALSLGWIVLSGEMMVLAAVLAALPVLLHAMSRGRAPGARSVSPRSPGRRTAAVLAGVLLGFTLGAGTLVPGARLYRQTVRVDGLAAESALAMSFPPIRTLELAAPHLLGHLKAPLHEDYWGASLYGEQEGPLLFSIYPGLLLVAAAVAAWLRRPSAEHGWAAVALAGLLLATGFHAPFWMLARDALPFVAGLRSPEKLILLVVLGVTVSGSAGVDLILRRQRTAIGVAASVLATAALAGFAFAFSLVDLPARFPGVSPSRLGGLRDLAHFDGRVLLATAGAGLAGLLVVRLRGRVAGGIVLTALLGLDLLLHAPPLLRTAPAKSIEEPPPWVRKVLERNDPQGRVFHLATWQAPEGESDWLAAPPMPAYWGLRLVLTDDYDLTELAWSHRATRAIREIASEEPALLAPILARRGVTAIVHLRGEARVVPEGVLYPKGLDSPLAVAVSAGRARPAFLAEAVRFAPDAAAWKRELRALGPAAATAAIVVDATGDTPSTPGSGELLRFSSAPGRIEADVRCEGPQPCFLALTETWSDGWSATIDGTRTPVRRTDLSLMGLDVPAGTRAVRLSYDDPSVRTGAILSGMALLGTLGLAVAGRQRRPRGGSGTTSRRDTLRTG